MEEKNNLSKLIAKDDLDETVLASILERFLKIDAEVGKIIILPDFSSLKSKDAILILLLGYKAIKLLKIKENELVGPKEIHEISGVNLSTVKNTLCDFKAKRLINSEKGKYFVPNFLLHSLGTYFVNLKLREQKRSQPKQQKSPRLDISRIETILQSKPSENFQEFYNFLIQEKGKYLLKCLIVLCVAKEKFQIDSLTAGEITHLLKNFLRVPMIHQSNITTALGARDSSRYIFKEKNEKGKYSYKLNVKGDEHIKQSIKEHESGEN
jgi:hypothetical protein